MAPYLGEVISILLTAITALMGIFVYIFKGLAQDVGAIKIAVATYKVKHEEHDRRLLNIEQRCNVHSNILHDIEVSIGGMK